MIDFNVVSIHENRPVSHLTDLETILTWEGSIDNERIRQLLDVKTVWASRLMGELATKMGHDARRPSAHAPLEFIGQSDVCQSADNYLQVISHHDDQVSQAIVEDSRLDLSPVQSSVFSTVFSATKKAKGLKMNYRSMSTPSGRESIVFPHSIVRAPRRWHMRAWCSQRNEFRDFTLGRIASVQLVETPSPFTKREDFEWNQILELIITAHPDLSLDQQDMIAAEYFPGANAKRLKTRQCLAGYVIQDLRLAIDPNIQRPPEYQLLLSNAEKLPELFISKSFVG